MFRSRAADLLDHHLPRGPIGSAQLLVAMFQARQAVARRSWSHPQQAAGEDWWADVLADPRARKRDRRVDKAIKQATYRLADERVQPSSSHAASVTGRPPMAETS